MALKLKGSTSGFVGLDAPSVAGNNTLILPTSAGSAHQILANDITAGVTTFTQVTISRNGDLTVPGTISIGGTLTYEDVTSVDSVGIVTARGLSIFGNTTGLNATGVSTFTGNVSMGGGNLILGDSGGASDDRIQLGGSQDLEVYHNGSHAYIDNSEGSLFIKSSNQVYIQDDQGRKQITCVDGAAVELYHAGVDSVRLQTTTTGVSVPTLNVTGISTFIGNVNMGGGNLIFGYKQLTEDLNLQGLEVSMNYFPSAEWTFNMNMSLLSDSSLTVDFEGVEQFVNMNTPKFKLGGGMQYAGDDVSYGMSLRYQDSYFADGFSGTSGNVDGFYTVGVNAKWNVEAVDGMSVGLSIDNITDVVHRETFLGPEMGRFTSISLGYDL
mgnify:CR=1 FL=1